MIKEKESSYYLTSFYIIMKTAKIVSFSLPIKNTTNVILRTKFSFVISGTKIQAQRVYGSNRSRMEKPEGGGIP